MLKLFARFVVVVVVVVDSCEDDDELLLLLFVVEVAEAKSNVVESTANSVGEPTKSKVIDEALEAGPEPFELAVEETEVAKRFVLMFVWLINF